MTIIHRNIHVLGRVQGVFYRASARQAALDLGIKGFVRNNADGSVYAEAEGRESSIQQFIDWCKTGPPAAKVTAVKVQNGEMQDFDGFRVVKY